MRRKKKGEDPDDPDLVKSNKTAVFLIRAPTDRKRAILLDAMKRTHLATAAVLDALLADFEAIREVAEKTRRERYMQDKTVYPTLRGRNLPLSGAAAARVDAIGMVESYVQQLADGRETASPPTVPPLEGREIRYEAVLETLSGACVPEAEENLLRDELNRVAKAPTPRPLDLPGYHHFYMLLRHPGTNRLYAWINLLPITSRFAPSQAEANRHAREDVAGDMIEITTGEAIRCKRPTWMLFPLEHGFDFHEREYLLAGEPKGGRLVFRPDADRFELHVMFEYESPVIDTARRYLGVDRGLHKLVAWAVTDADGRVIEDGDVSGLGLRHVQRVIERRTRKLQRRGRHVSGHARRAQSDEAAHVTANALVEIARRYGARVVLERLRGIQRRTHAVPKGDRGGRGGRNLRRILGRQQYAKIEQVLAYKLARAGLPPAIWVEAGGTSITCPECGHYAKENRPLQEIFCCVKCGHKDNADRNAARIISIKGSWLIQVPTKKSRGNRDLREDEKFPQYLADAIRRRGHGGDQPQG